VAKTEVPAEANVTNAISTLAHRRRWQPLYVVRGDMGSRFYAAKWKLPAHRVASECVMDHMLIYRVEGSTPISKIIGGQTLRKHSHPGIFTFIPSGERAQYVIENDSTFLELYIPPALIQRFSEQHAKSGRCASIQAFFAVEDSWLTGYFQMLTSEIETYNESTRQLDCLFLGQAQQLLLGHLLRTYSDVGPAQLHELDRSKGGSPLRPHLLRRVIDFIRANLAADIYMKDLAELVNLSEAHFIRAFYAATGTTPYQYILEERLHVCAELLRADNILSIAEVANSMGFKSQSHFATKFKARYGVTPTHYRHAADT
jgi:AraC family transcriptional regulator